MIRGDGEIQLVLPMAGLGSRFSSAGYTTMKPLLPVHSVEMYKVVLANLLTKQVGRCVLVAPKSFELSSRQKTLSQILGIDLDVVELDTVTDGPASTVEFALPYLDLNLPVVTANSDQYVDADLGGFYEKAANSNFAGVILTMGDDDPKWSYVKKDGQGKVIDVREKEVISTEATVGIYSFASASHLKEAIASMKREGRRVNGEYYIAPAYSHLFNIQEGVTTDYLGDVGEVMHGLGTPADYEAFLDKPVSLVAAAKATELFA